MIRIPPSSGVVSCVRIPASPSDGRQPNPKNSLPRETLEHIPQMLNLNLREGL